MTLQRSPTLALAAAVEAARASGERVYSLSTPTFRERVANLNLEMASTLLPPPQGSSRLRAVIHDAMLGKWNLPESRCPGHGRRQGGRSVGTPRLLPRPVIA